MVHDENPQLRWFFIRKIYSIITFQLLLTIPVISVVLFVRPVAHFFDSKLQGTGVYIVLIFVPLIGTCFILFYLHHNFIFWVDSFIVFFLFYLFVLICLILFAAISFHGKYPHNYFLLLFINVSSALPIGLTCVFIGGNELLKIIFVFD
jgi:hypothetical protein